MCNIESAFYMTVTFIENDAQGVCSMAVDRDEIIIIEIDKT